MPMLRKIPKPDSAIVKKSSKNVNEAGDNTYLNSAKKGDIANEMPDTQPAKTIPTSAMNGPRTIIKLKKLSPIVAQTARKTFPVVVLFVACCK